MFAASMTSPVKSRPQGLINGQLRQGGHRHCRCSGPHAGENSPERDLHCYRGLGNLILVRAADHLHYDRTLVAEGPYGIVSSGVRLCRSKRHRVNDAASYGKYSHRPSIDRALRGQSGDSRSRRWLAHGAGVHRCFYYRNLTVPALPHIGPNQLSTLFSWLPPRYDFMPEMRLIKRCSFLCQQDRSRPGRLSVRVSEVPATRLIRLLYQNQRDIDVSDVYL